MAVRDGTQIGLAEYARVKKTPWAARLSMFGVLM
jgi:hypothetical protein